MKTPHRIILQRGENVMGRYNPETDTYDKGIVNHQTVPCFVSVLSQKVVFEAYGRRSDKVISCRFQQAQEPFSRAIYDGAIYEPIEVITGPIKGSIRLKEVADGSES